MAGLARPAGERHPEATRPAAARIGQSGGGIPGSPAPRRAEAAALLERWAGRLASRPVLMARAQARALMGDALGARADLDESARLRDALGLSRDLDDLWGEPPVAQAAGDLRAAAEACGEALAQHPDDDALNRNFLLGTYARVLLDLGMDEQVWAAIDPLEASRTIEQRITHRSIRAGLLARGSEVEAALASINESSDLAAPTGLAIVKAHVALDRAHVLLATGRIEHARASAHDAWAATGRKSTRSARAARWRCSVR